MKNEMSVFIECENLKKRLLSEKTFNCKKILKTNQCNLKKCYTFLKYIFDFVV